MSASQPGPGLSVRQFVKGHALGEPLRSGVAGGMDLGSGWQWALVCRESHCIPPGLVSL